MKKNFKYIFIILIFLFSIYYTEKSMDILKEKDPLMIQIKDNTDKYKVEPVNATIDGNTIIPGINGQEVDVKKTYEVMRKYGSYNEGLTKIKKTKPVVSINNNYDKYIKLNDSSNKKIALLFIINEEININNLINNLNKNNVNVTLYFEDNQIEKNIEFIRNTKYEIELISTNNQLFNTTKAYLETLTNTKLKFCFTEEENSKILEICQKNEMHTIIPSLVIKKELYKNIKSNIETSPIIAVYLDNYIEKELTTTIKYLKKKGYKFYSLKSLITEDV